MQVYILKKNTQQSENAFLAFLSNFPPLGLNLHWTIAIAVAFVLWLLVSFIFVFPLWSQPVLAVQNDDYWRMSEWFGSDGPYPYSHFGPGFPFLIYLFRSIGFDMFGMVVILKIAIGLTGIALYHLGRTIGLHQIVAFIAAAAFTIFPIVQVYSSLFLAETLYLLLTSIAIAIILRQIQQKDNSSAGWLILGYSILGIAALVRVNAMLLLIGCLVIGLFTLSWRKIIVAGAIAIIPILGWSTLNWHWYGHFKFTSSADSAIATSIIGPVMIKQTGIAHRAEPNIWFEPDEIKQYSNLFELSNNARDEAIAYALAHPIPVIIANIKGWFNGLVGIDKSKFQRVFGEISNFWMGLALIIRCALAVGLIGFFIIGGYRYQLAFSAFLCLMLIAHLITGGAAGHARFGYPIDAFSVLALAFFAQNILRIDSYKVVSSTDQKAVKDIKAEKD